MDSNMNKGNQKIDFYNEAVGITWTGFEMRHPRELWPEWFTKCITVSGTKNHNKNWVMRITVVPQMPLETNQHWGKRNGKRVLYRTDPITGEERIIIGRTPKAVEVIFEVEVDFIKASATVITDTDLSLLDGTKYEICTYNNF